MAELDLLAITICADPSEKDIDLVAGGLLKNAAQRWECMLGVEQLTATFQLQR